MNLKRYFASVLLVYALVLPTVTLAQTAVYNAPKDTLDKIKDEGMNRSQIMQTLGYLSDVIGPRLTASPGMKRANDWTRDTMAKWGMANAHLEPWGPFGRGWTLRKFYAMVDGPTAFPLEAYPKAWSPGTDTLFPPSAPVTGKKGKPAPPPAAPASTAYTSEVVLFNPTNEAELDQFKGKVKDKIVLIGSMKDLKPHFNPDAVRNTDKELLDLADARDPNAPRPAGPAPTPNPAFANFAQQQQFQNRRMRFLSEEGAAIIVDGARGDFGTIFVAQASAIQSPPAAQGQPPVPQVRAWDKGAKVPVQVSVSGEQFNRIMRMINAGEKVTMTVDLNVEYQDSDPNGYNTIAEIPGTDKADEIVMLGGHLDSWHAGTGATDNGAGCAVMMEAMRIIKTLGLQPRRTIRMALWTGEEQGLLGSREYVKDHFGWRGDTRPPVFTQGGFGAGGNQQPLPLTKGKEYDKFSSYFNIDNGTGRIRGVYLQGNSGVAPIFKQWLDSFRDPHWFNKDTELGAYTLSLSNTGGTDHLSFDAIGLPGFQFIQDPIDYDTRTHHSNMDVFDRIQADDMKQMATVVAAFVYQAAMMDEQMPKKAFK